MARIIRIGNVATGASSAIVKPLAYARGSVKRRCGFVSGGRGFVKGRRGFTFVEMMVVITIIVILITIAIPIYQKSIIRSREAVLMNNLSTLRTVIDNYTYDKEKAPQSLNDLVSDGYLKRVPLDPIANTDQWKVVMEDATQAVNQAEPGIFDVHSTSDKIGLDGSPYSSK